MKTDLEIAQGQLELALNEIKSIKGRNVELLHDYVFEAHRLILNSILPDVSSNFCDVCIDFVIKDKMFVCKKCGKKYKSLSINP